MLARHKREKLETILRRVDWLKHRIATYRHDGNPSRAKQELTALELAIELYLEKWPYLALDPSPDEPIEDVH